jgi:hypothetical protein
MCVDEDTMIILEEKGIFNNKHLEYIKKNVTPLRNLIGYKEEGEYGTNITIYNINGDEYTKLFINNYCDEEIISKPYFISSCSYFGLDEQIFSNRTEYYICGKYYSNKINKKLESYIKLINKIILEDKADEELYNFIESEEVIIIFPHDILKNVPQNMFSYFMHGYSSIEHEDEDDNTCTDED